LPISVERREVYADHGAQIGLFDHDVEIALRIGGAGVDVLEARVNAEGQRTSAVDQADR
jgi:hypothetical protein